MSVFEFSELRLEQVISHAVPMDFDCGDPDLNEYFCKDSVSYRKELLTASYQVLKKGDGSDFPIALVDFCNDAVRREELGGGARRKIHHLKRGFKAFPAVKITRLGVQKELQGKGLGSLILDMIKHFLVEKRQFGCRFLTLDAYHTRVDFYKRNHFRELQIEAERNSNETVPMFFDLKGLQEPAL